MSTLLRSECLQCLTKQQFRSFPEDAKEEQKLVFLQRMYGILSEASGDVCAPVLVRDINELSREIFGCVHDYSEEKTYYNQLLLEKEQMIREKIQGTEDPLLKALQEFALDFERKVKSGHILAGEKMTYSEFIQKWLKDYARVQMKPTSVERCEISLNRQILPALGYLKVADIKPLHIQDLYTDLQEGGYIRDGKQYSYSANTIKRIHQIISSSLNTAVLWGIIDSNPLLPCQASPREKAG